MSSGRIVDSMTFKKGHLGGIGKIRCPKCHDYALKQNYQGHEVYRCKCGWTVKSNPVTSAPPPR